jgi:hypothetical protein
MDKTSLVARLFHAAQNHGELPFSGSFQHAVKVYAARVLLIVVTAFAVCALVATVALLSTVIPLQALLGAVVLFSIGGLVGAVWKTHVLRDVSRRQGRERRSLNHAWRALEHARRARGEALCARCQRLAESSYTHVSQPKDDDGT